MAFCSFEKRLILSLKYELKDKGHLNVLEKTHCKITVLVAY